MNTIRLFLLSILMAGCDHQAPDSFVKLGPDAMPPESYERSPEEPFEPGSYIITPKQMISFYDVPGETGLFLPGKEYGFESLSFILTETHPNGGPPLHTHSVEEAHILLSGSMDYIIGDSRISATAPYIARIPANVPHTFTNSGDTPLNLIGVLSTSEPDYEEIGPNPLVQ